MRRRQLNREPVLLLRPPERKSAIVPSEMMKLKLGIEVVVASNSLAEEMKQKENMTATHVCVTVAPFLY